MRTTVVRAARVVTMDGEDVEAIATLDGSIVATGAFDDLVARFARAEVVDYGDATILPGFNDAHMHVTMMAMQLQGVDLSPERTPSADVMRARLRDAAEHAGPDGWVRASRYDQTVTTGGDIVDRHWIDAVVPDKPVVVTHVGAHWGVVNTRALKLAGFDRSTADPPGGSYGRDAAGDLTGYLSEQALFDFAYPSLSRFPALCPTVDESSLPALDEAFRLLLAAGITSIGDAMIGPAELALLQLAKEQGRLPVRVNALVAFPHVDALARAGIRTGFGDEWLRIGGVKAFVDGAVAGRSCAVAEPFEGTDDRGVMTTDAAALRELAERADAAGLALAVHANGERAIELVLDVLESLPARSYRHRIEHCSIVTPGILRRMAALGVIAVPFAGYPLYRGDNILAWYGHERAGRMFAHRSFLDAGITVAGSSDYPCGPLPPLAGVRSMVERRSASGAPVGPGQRVGLREALRIYTAGSAEASGEGDRKGRLAPGHVADFVVIAGDLFALDQTRLADAEIVATWVGGVLRHERR
ncbi:MAG: amidohydrolase [Microbacterium sp.]|uniref:amidohydrolase n=1 Tax=Microbacterium sp. TaxID=51671 RepID=UPI0039E3B128